MFKSCVALRVTQALRFLTYPLPTFSFHSNTHSPLTLPVEYPGPHPTTVHHLPQPPPPLQSHHHVHRNPQPQSAPTTRTQTHARNSLAQTTKFLPPTSSLPPRTPYTPCQPAYQQLPPSYLSVIPHLHLQPPCPIPSHYRCYHTIFPFSALASFLFQLWHPFFFGLAILAF